MTTDDVKLGQMYQLSPYELERNPLQPSKLIRDREARMVGLMAEEAHLAGRKFADWPKFELRTDNMPYGGVLLRGDVTAVKA